MNCSIKTSKDFDKEVKRLAKRYRSLKQDIQSLGEELMSNPMMGTDLGKGIRKVRMAIGSKGKGKSHGARVITDTTAVINVEEGVITLLYIYDKAERSNITDKQIEELIQAAKEEAE